MAEIIRLEEKIANEFVEYAYDQDEDELTVDGHKYKYLDILEEYEDHRWNTTDQLIFKRDDNKLFALNYDIGKTEEQENGFLYSSPELYEVIKQEKVVTTVSYEKVKSDDV